MDPTFKSADDILREHASDVARTVGKNMSADDKRGLRLRFEERLKQLEDLRAPNTEMYRRALNPAAAPNRLTLVQH